MLPSGKVLVDLDDHVKKGQLLARIDPTIARQGVADAQANLEKVQAQAGQAKSDRNRNRALSDAGLIAGSALEQGGSTQKVADATVRSARVALDRAKQNLSFTSIYAPIDGVVVERNVNLGQTVAASTASEADLPAAQEEIRILLRESHQIVGGGRRRLHGPHPVRPRHRGGEQHPRDDDADGRHRIDLAPRETVISPLVRVGAVGFSGAVGVFFGFYPARKAAALNPIEALRYE